MVVERYGALGAVPVAGTPEQFTQLIRSETAKWAKVIAFAQANNR